MPVVSTYRQYMSIAAAGTFILFVASSCHAVEQVAGGIDRLVATVRVSPRTSQVPVGSPLQLSAVALDDQGSAIPNTTIEWRTTNGSRASVDASGLVSALGEGSVSVIAQHGAFADTASLTIMPAPAMACSGTAPWSCEPAGMTMLADHHFNSMEDGWRWQQKQLPGTGRIISEPGAPLGNNVLELTFPTGFSSAGVSPGAMRPPSPWPDPSGSRNMRELYWGFYWKANAEWQNHGSGINKIAFAWLNNQMPFSWVWAWEGNTGRKVIRLHLGGQIYGANAPGAFSLEPGQWYRIELYFRPSSAAGVADGQATIWVNGSLHGDHRNMTTTPGYFSDLYFDPTWGGLGGADKQRDDYFRISHTRFSVR